jgi:hypothetical protein
MKGEEGRTPRLPGDALPIPPPSSLILLCGLSAVAPNLAFRPVDAFAWPFQGGLAHAGRKTRLAATAENAPRASCVQQSSGSTWMGFASEMTYPSVETLSPAAFASAAVA